MLDMITLLIVGAGILQLPLIMDVIQHLCPESRIGRAVTRGMRALLVGCMLFCVTIALHTQVTTLLPEFVREPSLPPEEEEPLWFLKPTAVVHLLFSVWTYVQLVAHFVAACTQPASRIRPPPPSLPIANGEAGAGTAAATATAGRALKAQQLAYGADGTATFCAQCQVPKLLRTHHCKICGVCVELMDHHCPFTGNCVGRANFRVFYLWCTYGLVGISYAVAMSAGPFGRCVWMAPRVAAPGESGEAALRREAWVATQGASCARLGRAAYVFLPALFGWLSTLFVWAMQSLLLRRDVTTIEYLKNVAELSVRMQAPEDVRSDRDQREKMRLQRRRRKQAGEIEGGGAGAHAGADRSDDEDEGGIDGPAGLSMDEGSEAAMDVESGTPLSAPSPQLQQSGGAASFPVIAAAAAYNPHKSFQLVWQNLPLWTVLLPPFAVQLWQARAAKAHLRKVGAK